MNFLSSQLLVPYAFFFTATALSAGCQYECTGEDIPKVASLSVRADLDCPSVADAQHQFNGQPGLGYKVVSQADTKVAFASRQICWYRVEESVPPVRCIDHDPHGPFKSIEEFLAPRSREYFRSKATAPSGPVDYNFVYSKVISCDAGGRLYGVIGPPSDFSACPEDPPVDNEDHLTLSRLVGFDAILERSECQYNVTFRYMCGGLQLRGVFSPP